MNFSLVGDMESELQKWYDLRTYFTRFDGDININVFPPVIQEVPGNVAWLRCTYSSIPAVYLWHAVEIALTTFTGDEPLPPKYQEAVTRYCQSGLRMTASARRVLNDHFSPQVFQMCISYYPGGSCSLILDYMLPP